MKWGLKMKKIIFGLSILVFSMVSLAACGGNNDASANKNTTTTSSKVVASPNNSQNTNTSTSTQQSTAQTNENLDANGVLKKYPYTLDLNNATYKILSIQKSTGSITGDPVMVIEMEFTNKGNQPKSPYMSFVTDFDVQQTDGTTTSSLNGANGQLANLENQDAVKMGDANVNAGATVKAIIGYTLKYNDKPSTFIYRPSQVSGENNGFIVE